MSSQEESRLSSNEETLSSDEETFDPWDDFFDDFKAAAKKHQWSDRKLFTKMRKALDDNNFYVNCDGKWQHAQDILEHYHQVQDELHGASQSYRQLQAEREAIHQQRLQLLTEREGYRQQTVQFLAERERYCQKNLQLQAERDGSRQQILELQAEVDGSEQQILQLQSEKEGSLQQLIQLQAEKESSHQQILGLQVEKEGFHQHILKLQAEVGTLRSSLEDCRACAIETQSLNEQLLLKLEVTESELKEYKKPKSIHSNYVQVAVSSRDSTTQVSSSVKDCATQVFPSVVDTAAQWDSPADSCDDYFQTSCTLDLVADISCQTSITDVRDSLSLNHQAVSCSQGTQTFNSEFETGTASFFDELHESCQCIAVPRDLDQSGRPSSLSNTLVEKQLSRLHDAIADSNSIPASPIIPTMLSCVGITSEFDGAVPNSIPKADPKVHFHPTCTDASYELHQKEEREDEEVEICEKHPANSDETVTWFTVQTDERPGSHMTKVTESTNDTEEGYISDMASDLVEAVLKKVMGEEQSGSVTDRGCCQTPKPKRKKRKARKKTSSTPESSGQVSDNSSSAPSNHHVFPEESSGILLYLSESENDVAVDSTFEMSFSQPILSVDHVNADDSCSSSEDRQVTSHQSLPSGDELVPSASSVATSMQVLVKEASADATTSLDDVNTTVSHSASISAITASVTNADTTMTDTTMTQSAEISSVIVDATEKSPYEYASTRQQCSIGKCCSTPLPQQSFNNHRRVFSGVWYRRSRSSHNSPSSWSTDVTISYPQERESASSFFRSPTKREHSTRKPHVLNTSSEDYQFCVQYLQSWLSSPGETPSLRQ